MSLEDTIKGIKEIVNGIEGVGILDREEESVIESITRDQQDHVHIMDMNDNPLQLIEILLQEKKEQHQKRSVLVEKSLSKLEDLDNKKASIQARIELLEKNLKQDNVQPTNQNLLQHLQEKGNCMLAWKLLTGVNFDFQSKNVSGYHFNKKNGTYATFNIRREGDFSEKLWSVIKKNAKAGDA